MPNNPTRPVTGHPSAWGRIPFGPKVQPYKLTAGATDTMSVRVREKIDIHGIGTDVVEMVGVFTVRRDHPCAVGNDGNVEWGQSCVKTEFRSLELAGESSVFGTVRVHLDPQHASHGEVGPSDQGSLAAKCVAHCFPTIELPSLGLKLNTAGSPIKLASKVIHIPPVGDVARSENSAMLVDDQGRTVGEIVSSDIEVGELLWSTPLGSTRTQDEPEHVHPEGVHDVASGSQFYAQDPSGTGGSAPPLHDHGHVPPPEMPPSQPTGPRPPGPGVGSRAEIDRALSRFEQELHGLLNVIRSQVLR
jgi:hypothetical protein